MPSHSLLLLVLALKVLESYSWSLYWIVKIIILEDSDVDDVRYWLCHVE